MFTAKQILCLLSAIFVTFVSVAAADEKICKLLLLLLTLADLFTILAALKWIIFGVFWWEITATTYPLNRARGRGLNILSTPCEVRFSLATFRVVRMDHHHQFKMSGDPYTVCLLIWVAKLEMSHVLQSNKTKVIEGAVIAYQSLWQRFLTHWSFNPYFFPDLEKPNINCTTVLLWDT